MLVYPSPGNHLPPAQVTVMTLTPSEQGGDWVTLPQRPGPWILSPHHPQQNTDSPRSSNKVQKAKADSCLTLFHTRWCLGPGPIEIGEPGP